MTPPLPFPTLMLVTDRTLAGGEDALVRAVAAAVEGGVNAVQLREKDLPPAELLRLARRLRDATAGRALLIVNGPLDVAQECMADGVHLPEDTPFPEAQGPSPEPARPFIGRSVHSLAAAQRAAAEGADYLVAGPVYETRSHPGSPAAGAGLIQAVAGGADLPVLAIGGVTAGRVDEMVRAGASGVAVISAILGSADPGAVARELRRALREAVLDREGRGQTCVFCGIAGGKVPASVVYRDDDVMAFMDIQPVNPGHVLVVPLAHVVSMVDLEAATAGRVMEVARRVAAGLGDAGVRCEGFNLFLADGETAGQEVFHVHLHVIPRFAGDGFGLRFGPRYGEFPPRAELDGVASRIIAAANLTTDRQ